MVLLQRKHTFLRIQSWSNIFPGGGGGGGGSNFSEGGGVQLLISMETHITCDFPGRVWNPFFTLDPHMVLIHVHPRKLVLYVQGTRLLSTVLVQPRNQATKLVLVHRNVTDAS